MFHYTKEIFYVTAHVNVGSCVSSLASSFFPIFLESQSLYRKGKLGIFPSLTTYIQGRAPKFSKSYGPYIRKSPVYQVPWLIFRDEIFPTYSLHTFSYFPHIPSYFLYIASNFLLISPYLLISSYFPRISSYLLLISSYFLHNILSYLHVVLNIILNFQQLGLLYSKMLTSFMSFLLNLNFASSLLPLLMTSHSGYFQKIDHLRIIFPTF